MDLLPPLGPTDPYQLLNPGGGEKEISLKMVFCGQPNWSRFTGVIGRPLGLY